MIIPHGDLPFLRQVDSAFNIGALYYSVAAIEEGVVGHLGSEDQGILLILELESIKSFVA